MPALTPFRAWRYAPGSDLAAVTAPPYDVLSPAEAARYKARDRHNITHIDLPTPTASGYSRAGATLRTWQKAGILRRDATPSLTLYRLTADAADDTGQHSILGVIGALPVVDEGAGGVLPHEQVTAKASADRLDLTRATQANLSPVWGLSLAKGLAATLQNIWDDALATPDGPRPAGLHDNGVTHEVLPVTDPAAIAAIGALLEPYDVLIADGHHRYGVARRYRDEVRAALAYGTPSAGAGAPADSPAERTLAFVSELAAEQLNVEAIHRVYDGPSFADLQAKLADSFELSPAPAASPEMLDEMRRQGRLVLLAPDDSAIWLTPRAGVFDGIRALDGLWLEQALAGLPGLEVTYQHNLDELLAELPQHSGAVLIRPTSIAEIRRTATEGLLMPPKSTFFTPKLQTGLVLRSLDEP